MITDAKVREILVEFLAFENANSEWKGVIRPLKARSAPIDEWIKNTADIESYVYDDSQIGEVTSKILRNIKRSFILVVVN